MSKSSDPHPSRQAGVIPFRRSRRDVEFCLITSSKGRWGVPKGNISKGESLVDAALKEAREEAGLHGEIVGEPVGSYQIPRNGRPVVVTVLLMEVQRCDRTWPEQDERHRRWVTHEEACELICRAELRALFELARDRLR